MPAKKRTDVNVVRPASERDGLVLGLAVHGARAVAVGGQGIDLLLVSADGESFKPVKSPGKGLRGAWLDDDGLWVVGEWGYAASSKDLGKRWTRIATRTDACLFGIVRDQDGALWMAGDDGYVAVSSDGKSFRKLSGIREPIARIAASPLGVLVPTDAPGYLYLGRRRKIARSRLRAGGDLMSATVTPAGTLVAVGAPGVFRSTDGGKKFTSVPVPTRVMLTAVEAGEDGRVVAVGEEGTILFSADDGKSFGRVTHTAGKDDFWCCRRHGGAFLIGGASGLVLRMGGDPRVGAAKLVDRAREVAELRALTRAAIRHPAGETAAAALARLKGFAEKTRAAGHHKDGLGLRIRPGKPVPAAELARIEKALGVALPPSTRKLLATIGGVRIDGPDNNSLRVHAAPRDLAFDRFVGEVEHESDYYADLYGKKAKGWDWTAIAPRFARIALGVQFFEDDDEHEDGDVITQIVERDKPGEAPVWDLPHDDGYRHVRRGANAHAWFAHAVDRLIRAAYIRWSGKHEELEQGEAFDDGLAGRD